MKSKIFLLVFFSTLPFCSQASVYINEIMWQGYQDNQNHEWIELYNSTDESIDLNGWVLRAEDGTPNINLVDLVIAGGSYVLLERGGDGSADHIYTGALANTGEKLVLEDNSDPKQEIDSVDFSLDKGGWTISGKVIPSSSTDSFSLFDSVWKLGVPTPGSENIISETQDKQENTDENENDEEDEQNTKSSKSSSSEKKQAPPKPKEPKAEIQSNTYGFVGVPTSIKSYITDTDGSEIRKGLYVWNMGDGTVLYKAKKEEFQYTYQYPGEYVVSLSYSQGAFGRDPKDIKPLLYDEQVVNITDKTLTFETVHHDGSVTLKNNSSQVLPVENWKLSDGTATFTIPQKTMVRAGKTITFPSRVTYLKNDPVYLFNPSGEFVDSSEHSSASILPQAQASEISSQTQSSDVLSDGDDITKETILSLEDDFKEETLVAGASFSQQKTLYMTLFGLMVLLVGIIIWILFSYKKEPKSIEEYEIIEE